MLKFPECGNGSIGGLVKYVGNVCRVGDMQAKEETPVICRMR